MRIIYLDCSGGAAGDMLAGALLELLPEPEEALRVLNNAGLPGAVFRCVPEEHYGMRGSSFSASAVSPEEEAGPHAHRTLAGIREILDDLRLPGEVLRNAAEVYGLLANAEGAAHGLPPEEVLFHEVGQTGAIANVLAVCFFLDRIGADRVCASPVHIGCGYVECAHGILPVPAPAVTELVKGIPVYGGRVQGELCTPTAAALLKHFVSSFGDMPVLSIEKSGCGFGKKDFGIPNGLRAFLGTAAEADNTVLELSCNVDDMTAEAVAFAVERLFEGGAYEVYTAPVGMKKSRPGILIRVMCAPAKRDKLLALIFKHTTTIGVRETVTHSFTMDRKVETLDTAYGPVRRKVSSGYGTERVKYEYDDLARIAREQGISVKEVRDAVGGSGKD